MTEKEKKDKQEWTKKKTPIIENIEQSITLKEKALKNTNDAKKDLNESVGQLKIDLTRLYQVRDVLKSDAYPQNNPVTESSITTMHSLSVLEKESAFNVFERSQKVKTEATLLAGTVSTSSAVVTTMTSNVVYITKSMFDTEPIADTVQKLNAPTSNDRKNELLPKLGKIEGRLATKLGSAWQTLNDTTNNDRFSQAANSARELISDLLITLAPEEKVKLAKWFKPELENGKPTQRQRAKYAILGSNDSLTDNVLKPIDDLSKNIRDTYENLNPIAHQRNYEKDLQLATESIIDAAQIYLIELLKLRDIYFKE